MDNKVIITSKDMSNLESGIRKANKDLNDFQGNNVFGILLLAAGKIAGAIFELIVSLLNQIINRSPEYIQKLADYGWYISEKLGFRDIIFLAGNATIGNEVEVDDIMNSFIKKNTNKIKNDLIEKFPQREKYFESAFKAHKRKDYISSIPVFLTQIDWVSKKLLGVKFFSNKKIMGKFRPESVMWLEKINPDIVTEMLLSPLKYKSAFGKHTKDDDRKLVTRNEIFHGDDVDYDNETISNKAISLLHYLSTVVYDAKFKFETLPQDQP